MKTKSILFTTVLAIFALSGFSQVAPNSYKKNRALNPKPLTMQNNLVNSKKGESSLNPQPLPPKKKNSNSGTNALNPQPLPPKGKFSHGGKNALNPQPLPPHEKLPNKHSIKKSINY